jgi:hypothetical protein
MNNIQNLMELCLGMENQTLHYRFTKFGTQVILPIFSSGTSHGGPGSVVGIATDYRLDGPGIEARWGEIFRPFKPALGATQPPVQWVRGLLVVKCGRNVLMTCY